MTKYKIWCEVHGGVTGHRFGWLKSDGKEVMYDSKDDAERNAQRLNEQMNGPNKKANFDYSVVGFE